MLRLTAKQIKQLQHLYVHQFLDCLTDVNKLNACYQARYGYVGSVLESAAILFDKLGQPRYLANQRAAKQHFFGSPGCPDPRDEQLCSRDHFILDIVHSHVVNQVVAALDEMIGEQSSRSLDIVTGDVLPAILACLTITNGNSLLFNMNRHGLTINHTVFKPWLLLIQAKKNPFDNAYLHAAELSLGSGAVFSAIALIGMMSEIWLLTGIAAALTTTASAVAVTLFSCSTLTRPIKPDKLPCSIPKEPFKASTLLILDSTKGKKATVLPAVNQTLDATLATSDEPSYPSEHTEHEHSLTHNNRP